MRAEADVAGVTLEMEPAGQAIVSINRVQFELVVHNLVRNAVQAAGNGGRVWVRIGGDNGGVWLEVCDSGPGVPEELRERIFEPFVTTRQGRGGTGLGLAITRDIVVAHGGTIEVLANERGGTAMRIEVPVQQENA